MSQVGAHSQFRTGTANAPTALYLTETSSGVYEFDDAGPADAVLVLDTGVIQIDSDTAATGALSTLVVASTTYLMS
jgi:hypothetical protein